MARYCKNKEGNFKVGDGFRKNPGKDPWIPTFPDFIHTFREGVDTNRWRRVSDLSWQSNSWNVSLVCQIF